MSGFLKRQGPGKIGCTDVQILPGLRTSAVAPPREQRAPDATRQVAARKGIPSVANAEGRVFQRPESISMTMRAKAELAMQLEPVQGEYVREGGFAMHGPASRIARTNMRRRARCFQSRGGNKGGSSSVHMHARLKIVQPAWFDLPNSCEFLSLNPLLFQNEYFSSFQTVCSRCRSVRDE